MTAKKTKDKRQPWETDFVPCELNKDAKDALKKWDVKFETTFDELTRVVSDGYKLSVSYDQRHDCAIASLTSPKNDTGERQKTLVARGPDLLNALRAIAYKHFVILECEWSGSDVEYDPSNQWG